MRIRCAQITNFKLFYCAMVDNILLDIKIYRYIYKLVKQIEFVT